VCHNRAVLTLSWLAIKKNGRTSPGSPVRTQSRPVLNSVVVLSKARDPRICANCSGSHLVLPSDEDKWLHAPGSPVRTLNRPALNPVIVRTCDSDFSMGASQQTSSHAISFATNFFSCNILPRGPRVCRRKPAFYPMRIRPESSCFAPTNYSVRNPCFQSNAICVCSIRSVAPNSIKVTQFNQMAFWFFLGLLDCCRK
jgi:hypothetical protein